MSPERKKKPAPKTAVIAAVLLSIIIAAVAGTALFRTTFLSGDKPGAREPDNSTSTANAPPPASPAFKGLSSPAGRESAPRAGKTHGAPEKTAVKSSQALLAIIVDDMGSSLQEAHDLSGIGVPLTFSIIPGLRKYREVASFASSSGIGTMIHIPMQSKEWPRRRLEANGLLLSQSSEEISERVREFMRDMPEARGANNHTGSAFTENREKMEAVIGALKEKDLFYVDSITSANSVGLDVAKNAGVRNRRRDVFLDNEQRFEYIRGQLDQAVSRAKNHGSAIAICHPHRETINALAELLPRLDSRGVKLVKAADLLR